MTCFNPRPAFWPGATFSRESEPSSRSCFNPRPAFWPGATLRRGETGASVSVSILARPFGRALHHHLPDSGQLDGGFQSSPGLLAGRYVLIQANGSKPFGFNPRPAFWPGADGRAGRSRDRAPGFNPRPAFWPGVQGPISRGRFDSQFQSSPGLLAGRYEQAASSEVVNQEVSILARPFGRALHGCGRGCAGELVFQSSPGLLAGRYELAIVRQGGRGIVSILARPFGRRTVPWPATRPSSRSFNPRPAFWPGATALLGFFHRLHVVSILARPFGRALTEGTALAGLSFQCFNPRPAFWPGATCRRSRRRRSRSVVSILARPFGRALRSPGCTLHRAVSCFNPRPAFWPGATPRLPDPLASLPVSILARPFGRALPAARSRPMEQRPSFQSSPGLLAGRDLEWTASRDRRGCFNPRPAFWPGADGCHDGRRRPRCGVSILARPFGRALLPIPPTGKSGGGEFQSSPGLLAGRYRTGPG